MWEIREHVRWPSRIWWFINSYNTYFCYFYRKYKRVNCAVVFNFCSALGRDAVLSKFMLK